MTISVSVILFALLDMLGAFFLVKNPRTRRVLAVGGVAVLVSASMIYLACTVTIIVVASQSSNGLG